MREFVENRIEAAQLFWFLHRDGFFKEAPSALFIFWIGLIVSVVPVGMGLALLPIGTPALLPWLVAGYIGIESVLFIKGWLGRRIRPRLWGWWALALLSFGLIAFLLGLSTLTDLFRFDAMLRSTKVLNAAPATAANLALLAAVTQDGKTIFFRLYLDLFTIAAAVALIVLRPMPAGWASFRRFQAFLLALVILIGRPAAGAVFDILAAQTPDAGLDVLRLVLGPLLLPIGGLLTLLPCIVVLGLLAVIAAFVFVTLPLKVFDYIHLREQNAVIRAHKKAGLEQYLRRFDTWLRHNPMPFVPDESKGARFALPEEIAQVQAHSGFAFGHLGGRPLFLNTDKHVLMMASTRSGKGVTVIIPQLLRHRGSAFVLDPKGENARATGRRRAVLNNSVHYLDPFGISGKPQARFNPLAAFTAENMEAGSKALAGALILNEKRDHWTASGQQLLAAVILHVVTSADYPPDTKDLVTVRRLLLGAILPTLNEMRDNPAADGLVADLAASFLATPEKEFGSIISTAQRETEILDNPSIAACVAAAGPGRAVDFTEWHRGTMTVYLCLSAPKFPVFNRWLRLVLTAALDTMTDQLNPPPLPVCFMLDELATLGHLGVIENAIGLAAGYGIQLVTVFQDIAQMKDLYKGRWASFIGNAGVRALFSIDDYDSAKYWSDFLGGHLVGTVSQSQDIYGLTKGQTAGESLRPLLSPESLMLRYASDRLLVLKQGMRPIETARVPYWLDAGLTGLWDDPRLRPQPQPAPVKPHINGPLIDRTETPQAYAGALAYFASIASKPPGGPPSRP